MPSEIEDAVARQRAALLRRELAAQREMARQWLQIEERLAGRLDALTLELANMQEPVPLWRLAQMDRYNMLMQQVDRELTRYAQAANEMISGEQRAAIEMALEDSEALVKIVGHGAQIAAGFNRLPVAAVQTMIGLSGDGSPLRAILADASRVGPQALADALVRGVALGYNPRKTARMAMREGLAQTYARTLLIARTETLRAHREAGRANYLANSGIVTSYVRMCAKDKRTCVACLALDGKVYALNEPLAEHPNGRCNLVPVVKGAPPPKWQAGTEWFEEQAEETQRGIMGAGRYDLWKSGQASWADMVHVHADPVWGPSPRVTPLHVLANQ